MNRKKLIFFAMICVLIALLISYFVLNYEPKYAENEITEDLCIEIVRQEMEEDMPIQIAGIQKVDDSIIVGYAVGKENQMKTFGFLQFVLNKNTDKYKMYHNHNDLLETSFLDISVGKFSTNFVDDTLLKPYYIFLCDNSNLKEIDLLEKINDEYQIQDKITVCDGLFMSIWVLPEAGKYTFLRDNNEEWFSRYFVSDTQLFTDNNGNELSIRFDIDYSDMISGGQANISSTMTLVGATNLKEYYAEKVILRQTSRPCTAWMYISINNLSKKLSVDLGQHIDTLLSNIEIPNEYDNITKIGFKHIYVQSSGEYVRSIQVMPDKKNNIKLGYFFSLNSKIGDYFNKPDYGNDLLQDNKLKIEWLIDIKSNSEKETKTYTVRQNVPIIIK